MRLPGSWKSIGANPAMHFGRLYGIKPPGEGLRRIRAEYVVRR